MSIKHTLQFITSHPLNADRPLKAIWRFAQWQWKCRTQTGPHIVPFVEKTRLWAKQGWTGVTGNIYAGLHEYEDMAFLLHFLRHGDVFADVGANHGSYTVLASGVCGAFTHAFEPVPETFKHLQDNITLNHLETLTNLHQAAVGSEAGEIWFTQNEDTTNHAETSPSDASIKVPCLRLDDVLDACPVLMKIDVEGFETEVLNGAEKLLRQQTLKAIIIELNGSGGRYGYNETALHHKLVNDWGFQACRYHPASRSLEVVQHHGAHNTLYVWDMAAVEQRIENAPKRAINHHNL